jgi:hypothetical protein
MVPPKIGLMVPLEEGLILEYTIPLEAKYEKTQKFFSKNLTCRLVTKAIAPVLRHELVLGYSFQLSTRTHSPQTLVQLTYIGSLI